MNIKHSSNSVEWFTPLWLIDMCKEVLGEIDLDPASCTQANLRVGAKRIITEAQDGLKSDWGKPRTVLLNPPGSKLGNKSMSGLFWKKLMEERPNFGHAIYIGFSLEQIQITQNYHEQSIGHFPLCIPKKRIAFDAADGTSGKAPSHSNVIVYVPGAIDRTDEFQHVFSKLGVVIEPTVECAHGPVHCSECVDESMTKAYLHNHIVNVAPIVV